MSLMINEIWLTLFRSLGIRTKRTCSLLGLARDALGFGTRIPTPNHRFCVVNIIGTLFILLDGVLIQMTKILFFTPVATTNSFIIQQTSLRKVFSLKIYETNEDSTVEFFKRNFHYSHFTIAEVKSVVKKNCTEFSWKPDYSCIAIGYDDG